MPSLSLQIDEALLNRVKAALGDMSRRAPQAISGAINETLAEGKTELSRDVRSILNLPKKNVDERIKVDKSTPQTLSGRVRLLYEKRPGLYSFGAREVARGVTAKLLKAGGRKLYEHAFIAAKRGQDHLNVFIRKMVGGKRVGRKPLVRLMGLSPWGSVVYPPGTLDTVFANAQANFEKNLQQRINSILGGYVKETKKAA